MRNTKFLEPLPSESNDNDIKKGKNNLNKIKKFMLRKLFQEKKVIYPKIEKNFLNTPLMSF